jgi:hypothetical protein
MDQTPGWEDSFKLNSNLVEIETGCLRNIAKECGNPVRHNIFSAL